MPQKLIDQTTIQPDGKPGDDAFTAFETCNDNFQDAEARLVALEAGGGETGDRLDNEIATRAAADSALGVRIDAEHSLIAQEATSRANADTALSARIADDNYLINGSMSIWQRGDSIPSTANQRRFCADRWVLWTGGNKPAMAFRQSMQDAAWLQALEQVRPEYAAFIAVGEAGTANDSFVLLQQPVEGVGTLAGGEVTASFAIWVDKATKIGVGFWQNYDDQGSVVVVAPKNVSLVPGWQYVTVTQSLPALSVNRTRGPRNHMTLNIWLAASNDPVNSGAPGIGLEGFTTWITNVKLESGSVATRYRPRLMGEEVALCERFYQKSYNLSAAPGSTTNEGRQTWGMSGIPNPTIRAAVQFRVRMRAAPAITTYGAPSGVPGVISQADGTNVAGYPEAIGSGGYNAAWSNSNGQWGGWWHWTADAEF